MAMSQPPISEGLNQYSRSVIDDEEVTMIVENGDDDSGGISERRSIGRS